MDVKPKKKNKELSKDKTEVKEKKSKKSKIVKGVSAVKDATANDDEPKPKKSKKRSRQDDEKSVKKTKKRKTTEEPAAELEIDITAPNPPSKKALRLQKKGKPVPPLPSTSQPPTTEPHPVDTTHPDRKKLVKEIVRADFGVWIGNMSYKSDVKALRDWLVRGEKRIADKEITRINVPLNADGQSKGYGSVIDVRLILDLLMWIS